MVDSIFSKIFGQTNYDGKCIGDAIPLEDRKEPVHYSAFFGFGIIVAFELLEDLVEGGEADAKVISLQDPTKVLSPVTVYDPAGIGFYGFVGNKGYATPVYVQPFDNVPGNNAGFRRKLFTGSARSIDTSKFKFAIINMQCPRPGSGTL